MVQVLFGVCVGIVLITPGLCQDGCKVPAEITAESGVISTPYYDFYPEFTYPEFATCRWTITVSKGKNIKITFEEEFSIEGSLIDICENDHVSFHSPERATQSVCSPASETILGPLCGSTALPPFVIAGNSVVIEFCSDFMIESQGFKLNFTETDDPPTMQPIIDNKCTNQKVFLTEESSYSVWVTSPGYPGTYPDDASCSWLVSAPDGVAIEVSTTSMLMEECAFDFIELIEPSSMTSLGRFCGENGPKNVRSPSNQILLVMLTDSSVGYTGFNITFTRSPCPPQQTSCPNDPDSKSCFRETMLCDGHADCPYGLDEYCPSGCGVPTVKPVLATKMEQKIVGGVEARPHSWPWQAALLTVNSELLCGASIIDRNWLVTAGHCCNLYADETSSFHVRVGEHDLNGPWERDAVTYSLSEMFVHPAFESNPHSQNDFCLLKTTQPMLFSDSISPICLNANSNELIGKQCFVTGWGSRIARPGRTLAEEDQAKHRMIQRAASNSLRQASMNIATQEYCNLQYGGSVTPEMICAQSLGRDTCQGDSGGPLVCRSNDEPGRWELVGITSWALGCADPKYPSVFARISTAIEWIAHTILESNKHASAMSFPDRESVFGINPTRS